MKQLRNPRRLLAVLAISLPLSFSGPASAQQFVARVVDAGSELPLPGVTVELLGAGGDVVGTAVTDDEGQVALANLAAGRYTIVMQRFGYLPRRLEGVLIGDGTTTLEPVALTATAFRLNPLVVSPSRGAERAIEAPASVHTVGRESIERRVATLPVDHVRELPGIDVISSGLARVSVAARGFNKTLNGDLLVLTDNRWSSVPSLRFNAMNLIPVTDEDVERMEVVLGPGSALYGPNSASGVLHIITRSPLDHQGGSASLTFGERSLFQGAMRYAGLVGENVGYKVSGSYFRGLEWKFTDPVEATNRAAALEAGADPGTLLIGARDFDVERYTVDGRMDVRLSDQSTLSLSTGLTELSNSIEQVQTNTAQAQGWKYAYFQAALRTDRSFAQAYVNWNDAGDTYLLRSGEALVDMSLIAVAQAQHRVTLGERQSFVAGVDLTRTVPRTDGTIHGSNEDRDDFLESGGYVQSETQLSERLRLVTAARVDYHNYLESTVFSPRAALVLAPAEDHNLRLTFNRSFLLPAATSMFADLVSSPTLGGLPFAVRVAGPPNEGFRFRRDCQGPFGPTTLCMRSPFTPAALGGPSQFFPVDATLFWAAAVQIMKAQDAQAGSLLELMAAPTASQIGSVLRALNTATGSFDLVEGVSDLDGLGPSITNTFEVGYKGLIQDRLFLSVDVYRSRVSDLVSPFFVLSPNVFLDPQQVGQYLASEAARLQLPLPQSVIAGLAGGLASIPLGTVVPDSGPSSGADLLLSLRNFGQVDLWGTDIRATLMATEEVSVSGSYSFVSDDLFEDVDDVSDVPLNAPRHKGAAKVEYWSARSGFGVGLGARVVGSFPFASGVFAGTIDSYSVVDASLNYALGFLPSTQLTVSGTNIFDNRHQEAIGAPFIGRMLTLRVRREF